ncbi:DUF5131 family protein [Streptomyces sp.]|uniref:DUF5131 family protein n=1 Tax=Streptomyces sp. TaxID=1931 RepID=UPI002F3E9E46
MTTTATTIEWTRNDDGTPGRTWNPVSGCTKVSPGCDNCYAETIAERFRGSAAFPHGFDVRVKPDRMNDPLAWRKATRVFVNSMSDLFHADIDQAWIAEVFGVMAAARRHTFQLLTKRHARMRTLLTEPEFVAQVRSRALGKGLPADQWAWPLPNLWLGVSVENQQWADIRIPALLDTPAAVRWISAEPLLGPVTLFDRDHRDHDRDWDGGDWVCLDCSTEEETVPWRVTDGSAPGIGWVVVGGESGPGARPMHPGWARSLRDQCTQARVPYFFKQWGEWVIAPSNYGPDVPERARAGTTIVFRDESDVDGQIMLRVGKGRAGRLLDGREHNDFPAVSG